MRLLPLSLLSVVVVAAAACPPPGQGEGEGEEGEGEGEEGAGEGEGEGGALEESEPNGGDPVSDVDVLPVGVVLRGVIDGADDVDFFALEGAVAGHVYVVDVAGAEGDGFDPRVAVLDDGRGGDAPGADYVRLGHLSLQFAVLGGGVFIAVDDDVGSGGGYSVIVGDVTDDVSAAALSGAVDDDLGGAGRVRVYPFAADPGDDVAFDVVSSGDADLRLFVVSLSAGDWIARNDDRSAGDLDPLLDAPLFEEGPYVLLVENNDEDATDLGYTLTPTLP